MTTKRNLVETVPALHPIGTIAAARVSVLFVSRPLSADLRQRSQPADAHLEQLMFFRLVR